MTPPPGPPPSPRAERAFALALPALVQGRDTAEREFDEQIETASLSARMATFRLRAEVPPGAKLRIRVWVPRTILLEKPLQVCLTGTVCETRPERDAKPDARLVSLRLDNTFRITPLFA